MGTVALFANPGQTISLVVQTTDGYSSSDGYIFQESVSVSDGQTSFVITYTPDTSSSVSMFINGMKQVYGIDYSVSGTSITYLNELSLISTDVVDFSYFISGTGTNTYGARVDVSTPQVMSIYFPDRSYSEGFPQTMTRLETGLYFYDIIIPTGLTSLGTFIASTMHTEGNNTVWNTFIINVARPFGNSSASPI